MGRTASVLVEEEEAADSPFGMWESGTRIGLCLRIDFFFCDLPMVVVRKVQKMKKSQKGRKRKVDCAFPTFTGKY
jgi:hypothetical protein